MTVNRERVQLLVDALRSGDYEQGTGRLEKEGKFCCLGVACRVAMANGLHLRALPDDDDDMVYSGDDGDESFAYLPEAAKAWYGFDVSAPKVRIVNENGNERVVLAHEANDQHGLDFAAIADAFERTYLREETEK